MAAGALASCVAVSFQCTAWYLHHDDVIKWKRFLRYWPFVWGIHRRPVNPPHKGQWRGALMFSLICICINSWINNREAGYLIPITLIMTSLYDMLLSIDQNATFSYIRELWLNCVIYSYTCKHGINCITSAYVTGVKQDTFRWLISHASCLSSSQHYLQGFHKVSNSFWNSIFEIRNTVCLHPFTTKLHL